MFVIALIKAFLPKQLNFVKKVADLKFIKGRIITMRYIGTVFVSLQYLLKFVLVELESK